MPPKHLPARPMRVHPLLGRWLRQQARELSTVERRRVSAVEASARLARFLTGHTLDTLAALSPRDRVAP